MTGAEQCAYGNSMPGDKFKCEGPYHDKLAKPLSWRRDAVLNRKVIAMNAAPDDATVPASGVPAPGGANASHSHGRSSLGTILNVYAATWE